MFYMTLKQKNRFLELEVEVKDDKAVVNYAQYTDGHRETLDKEALKVLVDMYQDEIDQNAYEEMLQMEVDRADRLEDV